MLCVLLLTLTFTAGEKKCQLSGIDGETPRAMVSASADTMRTTTCTEPMQASDGVSINVTAFNCQGLKGSQQMISRMMSSGQCDVLFLSEHWLRSHELSFIDNHYSQLNLWTHLKSGMDPEVEHTCGRPYGGVGFICQKRSAVSYIPIEIPNKRLSALQICIRGSPVVTVVGVYLPHYNGTSEQVGKYSESLDEIQGFMDACETPLLVVGDMNAPLPAKPELHINWYRQHPFNANSRLLYDFTVENDLRVVDMSFKQPVNYTFSNDGRTSYIDHILTTQSACSYVRGCNIMANCEGQRKRSSPHSA